jgi:sortase A
MMKKKSFYFVFILLLFSFGFYLTSTNVYKIAKAYIIYKQTDYKWHRNIEKQAIKKQPKSVPLYTNLPKIGEQIGTLEIPTIHSTLPIYHGTDEDELEKGIGHYAKSVLPGENDNSVLAGHRDTIFRHLGEVKLGDQLIVSTSAGTFTYKVRKIRIVDKDDRTVIVPKPRATLTVSTCYPFRYIGPAPQRYVLIANLVHTDK